MNGLEGKTAIVTGGSSGIGRAIGIRLGHEGVNVAINCVGPVEGADATKEAIDAGVRACIDEVNGCPAPATSSSRHDQREGNGPPIAKEIVPNAHTPSL
jgi:NAD(P)-dependent dehydrogenase (short-subunit alcohol dehydrogenase family)